MNIDTISTYDGNNINHVSTIKNTNMSTTTIKLWRWMQGYRVELYTIDDTMSDQCLDFDSGFYLSYDEAMKQYNWFIDLYRENQS